MISFINKTIPTPEHIPRTPGKMIKGKVVWKSGIFRIRVKDTLYDLFEWDNLSECTHLYCLPTNSFHTVWYKKPYFPPVEPDKDVLAQTLRYWGKYWHGMTLYGKIVDGVFHPRKKRQNESNIPEATAE